jgi:3-oxoacyl-[acyl-carrier-protein] synthase II
MGRRVVITGLGAVSGFGVGVGALWDGMNSGKSAIRRIAAFDPSGFACRLGAEAAGFTGAKDYVPKSYRKAVKVMARDTELAVAAAKLAVEDAGLLTRATEGATPTYRAERMGCHIGAGLIAAETDELTSALVTARTQGADGRPAVDWKAWGNGPGGAAAMNNLQPLWLLKYLPNMLACHVTIIQGAEGPSNTITCLEASGLLCLGESTRVIQRGAAELCFSGCAEAPINFMRMARMALTRRLAATGDSEEGASIVRPYDPQAPGQVLGEGAGVLILEEAESARARGAAVYAEVVGIGAAQSGPAPDGWTRGGLAAQVDDGLQFAMENAIEDAGVRPDDIDAVVPHGSGIAAMDSGEAGALRAVFGARIGQVPLVTVVPQIGDCMAAGGGLAAAVAAKCLREQRLPARLNAGTPVEGMNAGAAEPREARLRHILVATGSLGGQNAAVVLRAVGG